MLTVSEVSPRIEDDLGPPIKASVIVAEVTRDPQALMELEGVLNRFFPTRSHSKTVVITVGVELRCRRAGTGAECMATSR